MRDVVIVGAGHNALVAACYLAREGLDVEVVEGLDVVGGATASTEAFPGYHVDRGASLHILIRHTGIVEDLQLESCGLRYLDADPWAFAPFAGESLTFFVDVDLTCDSIAKVCGDADAEAYARFIRDWSGRSRVLFDLFGEPPTARHVGRALWRLKRTSRGTSNGELARQFLQPANAILDDYFHDDRLKTALAWLAAQSGPPPHEQGTAELLGWTTLMHSVAPGRPVGGSGALARALATRFSSYGGSLRLADPVQRIITRGRQVTGVLTRSGERIEASAVVAGCHVLTTMRLLDSVELLDQARRCIRVGNGIGLVVRLGTRALPRYPNQSDDSHHGMQLIAASRTQLAAAYGDYAAGRAPRHPPCIVLTPTALDPGLAPPGKHTVTIWGQWYPYELADTDWDAVGDTEALKLVAMVEAAAPGFAGTIEHVRVQTPADLERELGLIRGNVMHVEMGLDTMFGLRPMPGWSGYRTPYRGLYLTGASTHPGGGVSGASGRSAARVLLADRRSRRPRFS